MPLSTTPSTGPVAYEVWVTGPNDVEFRIEVVSQVHTEENADAALQSLVDHLTEWPDLTTINYANKTRVEVFGMTPTPAEPTP